MSLSNATAFTVGGGHNADFPIGVDWNLSEQQTALKDMPNPKWESPARLRQPAERSSKEEYVECIWWPGWVSISLTLSTDKADFSVLESDGQTAAFAASSSSAKRWEQIA